MTQETFKKAVSIQEELTTYREIQKLTNRKLVYFADAGTVYNTNLPKDLLSCIDSFCSKRICELTIEFQEL